MLQVELDAQCEDLKKEFKDQASDESFQRHKCSSIGMRVEQFNLSLMSVQFVFNVFESRKLKRRKLHKQRGGTPNHVTAMGQSAAVATLQTFVLACW